MFVCGECGWAQPTAGQCNDGTTLVPIGDDLLLGTSIGAFRIARLLGVGGMGRVYKGVHPQIGSRVAIKVLSRECSDRRDLVERFFAEARAVNLVNHEGIVNVLDLNSLPDGRPYIIMEYLDGAPLSAILDDARARGQQLPIGSIARIAVEVLDALGAAHAKGIIHRDLKPDNIFVTPGGRPKVLDFGIAKLQPELGGNSATHTGSLLGTPQYMAPEQASGRVVDARADLYAIGCILYECMTLHRPFVADSLFDLLRKQIEEPVRPPRQLRAELPPDVEHVLLVALSKRPDERFGSASAMSQALQHATAQLAPDHWAPITPSGSIPPVRSNPSWGARQAPSPPPPLYPPTPSPHAATVPSDPNLIPRAQPRQPAASRGWLYVLVAVIVVGGGITTAVIATRGGGSAEANVARGDGDDAPAPPKHKHARPKRDDDDDDDDRKFDQLSDHILQQVDQQMADVTAQVHTAIGGAPTPVPTAKPITPVKPTVAEAPPGAIDELHTPDGWLVRHALRPYDGYDPKNIDISAFLAFAIAQAKIAIPDAQLVRFDIDNVDATGHADLTLQTHMQMPGSIDARFVSKAHMPPDPNGHKPFGYKWACEFRVIAEPDGIEIRDIDMSCTMDTPIRMPRCTVADLWKRAAAKNPNHKRVELDYRNMGASVPTWNMAIFGELEESYRDDCK